MPMDRTMNRNAPTVIRGIEITPVGWQFMARELEEMANQIRKGKGLTEDDAIDLDNIAVILRLHADNMRSA